MSRSIRQGDVDSSGAGTVTSSSAALEWLWQDLGDVRRPHVLDCGSARQRTVEVLLRRGAKLYVADLLSPLLRNDPGLWTQAAKTRVFHPEALLTQLPGIPTGSLSAIFCWHLLDLLPPEALPEVMSRLLSLLEPGGALLCLLREPYLPEGADTAWVLEGLTTLATAFEGTKPFPYPALTNREMERLLPRGKVKTFLTRSGRREVVAIK